KWNLWGYVDVRDAAAVCRNALEADVAGSQSFIIAAADTIMTRSSAAMMADVFPGVELTRELGEFETLLAIDAARDVLGYDPKHSWREFVAAL
ncbi:MAG: NAD(P)-dependent oxidoreductase, partial [Chloroflexota bacterium]|nr:NAD(P)-dependent oxidoreductase [Chloroflexota bacterium]